jgi:hypothetical protein
MLERDGSVLLTTGPVHPSDARLREGKAISTGWVESAINEIIAKRMAKAQQMRWNRWTVQPFLAVCTAVLNGTLVDSFQEWLPEFRPVDAKYPERMVA